MSQSKNFTIAPMAVLALLCNRCGRVALTSYGKQGLDLIDDEITRAIASHNCPEPVATSPPASVPTVGAMAVGLDPAT